MLPQPEPPSSEHSASTLVAGDPDAVFAYLADIRKLSTYLPTVTSASITGREDAEVATLVGGVPRTFRVWVRAYRDRRHLAWGTVDNAYRGELLVSRPRDAEAEGGATATVTITLASELHLGPALRRALDEATGTLERAIRAAGLHR